MRKALRVLIEKLVELREKFDNNKEHVQLLVVQLRQARNNLERMHVEINDLMQAIDDLESVK